jgi:glycosyltransferase involved in cell wall biosynthesis
VFNGISADGVLYPPLPAPQLYGPGRADDYFLYSSRLAPIKRQELAIEAMRYVRGSFRLKLIGQADWPPYTSALQKLAAEAGVTDRVDFLGWVDEQTKANLTRNASGTLYIPYQEDSYGFSTLEALHCHKPMITMADSGGSRELISDGYNGLVVEPSASALAEAMDRLWADPARASRLGNNGFEALELHDISWPRVVHRLLGLN